MVKKILMYGILAIVTFLCLTMAIITAAPYMAATLIVVFFIWLGMKDDDEPTDSTQSDEEQK